MHTDLMRSACAQSHANERISAEAGKAAVIGDCRFALARVGNRLETFSVCTVAHNLRFYDAAFHCGNACNNQDIFFFGAVRTDLFLQYFFRGSVSRCDNHARGVFVESVYDSRA